jgi:predicted translin family RNA/ssDNA-binding protein
MAKKSSRNNDFLYNSKANSSPQIYSLLINLVNQDREDLAQAVIKIDYLLEYVSRCIKQKDFEEANISLNKAKIRIDMLKTEEVNTEHLEYLYAGIAKKGEAIISIYHNFA